jgi:hypothetical protein
MGDTPEVATDLSDPKGKEQFVWPSSARLEPEPHRA